MSSNLLSGGVAAPAIEYRSAPRYRILQRCFTRPPGVTPPAEGWRSIAYNISTTGIGVTLPLPLPKGSVVEIEPHELPGAKPVRARIVHSSRLEFVWLCGCRLDEELSDAELNAWLSVAPART